VDDTCNEDVEEEEEADDRRVMQWCKVANDDDDDTDDEMNNIDLADGEGVPADTSNCVDCPSESKESPSVEPSFYVYLDEAQHDIDAFSEWVEYSMGPVTRRVSMIGIRFACRDSKTVLKATPNMNP